MTGLSFQTDERKRAERVANTLYIELKRIGIELDDLDIIDPCSECIRDDTMIRLGNMRVDDVDQAVKKLRAALCASPREHTE
ncbi:hypothetical protein [Streptomyces alkaliterrae]|uniref:Uncharacterized protein n=1 Tax=Streptomyces alkaliterrae TaxID=2213162 RepID=A0A5P0YIT9_9ACTN|nr:hypothetical protein [Streptomyces alkaliterrae]MBB1251867.1 hypothetical protein [Streptomyces alkaliterrae]MBB1259326.1 hypothetical protein [Streptomyces alkaliterrae]MQS00294.1 hypothetical protein [Streptomyces alkaliterrae]